MVVWNSTEAEFNTKNGEVILHSRHTLALSNNAKIPKIVGAVSLLLIQDEVSGELSHLFKPAHPVIDVEENVSDQNSSSMPNHNAKITIPASLSFVPMPSVLLGNDIKSSIQSEFSNIAKSSEKRTIQEQPLSSTNHIQPQFKSTESVAKHRDNQLKNLQSVKETNVLPNTSLNRNPPKFPDNHTYSDEIQNKLEMYIKHEPSNDNFMNDKNPECNIPTDDWMKEHHDLFKAYNPYQSSDPKLPASGLIPDHKPENTTFAGQSNLNLSTVKKVNRQEDFNKSRVLKPKFRIARKGNPAPKIKNQNQKCVPRCSECNISLTSYKDLINHNIVHGKISECPVCNKYFTTRGSFIRHSIAHMQKRSFPCPCCFACFTRKDNLKRHFNVHHKNSNWKPDATFSVEDKQTGNDVQFTNVNQKNTEETDSGNQSLPIFPSFCTNVPNESLHSTTRHVKSSNLNSIVDNLHGKKTKLPLLRSILTSKGTSGRKISKPLKALPSQSTKQKEQNFTWNQKQDSEMGTAIGQTINYMCSACNIGFSSLANMKCHIVRTHGEDTTNDQSVMSDAHLERNSNNFCSQVQNANETEPALSSTDFLDTGSYKADNVVSNASSKAFIDLSKSPDSPVHNQPNSDIQNQLNLSQPNYFQRPSEFKEATSEIDIESWVKNHSEFEDRDFSITTVDSSQSQIIPEVTKKVSRNETSTSSMYLVPSQIPISSAIPDNRTYFSSPYENIGNQNNSTISQPTPQKSNPKKRRITLHTEMTVCRLCGLYLESGSHIVQHGTQHHSGQLDSFTCVVCLTKLRGYDSLYRHCQLHFGVMFSCQHCDSKFTRKDNLTRHIKNTHGNQNKGLNETV